MEVPSPVGLGAGDVNFPCTRLLCDGCPPLGVEELPITHNCWTRPAIRAASANASIHESEDPHKRGRRNEIPPWYSPDKLKPVYESESVKAYWDVPIYADQQEASCSSVDARIVNHMCKRVVTLEMSCPWVNTQTRKDEEKTLKYGPLRWELRQQFPGYEVKQYNIIMDALEGWSWELNVMMPELVGWRRTDVLRKMQRAVLSGTLNIARTFKVAV
ncbi:hypothetical protein AWC38_SpisGene24251 [Stylophora pistillata]|uniref:Uncharacterized protein n=1 Tax=Stylophora pistillata TaxID=50429 RepID=A0A2B4R5W0_STYPI|nr:hypothetical protein AWC38_SpisGene24251 [Stylophora pistillata]